MKQQKILTEYRRNIDKITEELVKLIAKRKEITFKINELKRKFGLPLIDYEREKEVIENAERFAKKSEINSNLVVKIMKLVMNDSRKS